MLTAQRDANIVYVTMEGFASASMTGETAERFHILYHEAAEV